MKIVLMNGFRHLLTKMRIVHAFKETDSLPGYSKLAENSGLFHTVASQQKKQKFRQANIPYSISLSAYRCIYLKKKEKRPASFQANKGVVLNDVRLTSAGNHLPKIVSNCIRCRKCSRKGQEKRTRSLTYVQNVMFVSLGIATCFSSVHDK
ncbi:hypothetical protein TNCV_2876611 [Trichonephila clavipes]|nr:hypothetical protein TNCV_2876611 [Trichonephila clavipes]